MTVFKGYFLIMRRNFPSMLMYFAIFIAVCLIIAKSSETDTTLDFSSVKLNIQVIDQDGGEMAQGLKDYLAVSHNVSEAEYSKEQLQEEMYYGNIDYIVTIPENFEVLILEKGEPLEVTKVPDSYMGFYADQCIDNYINGIKTYQAAGFSSAEAAAKVLEHAKEEVEINLIDLNGNGGEVPGYYYVLRFLPYAILGALCMGVGFLLMEFKDKDRRARINCAGVSTAKQSITMAGVLLLLGVVIWGLSCLLPIIMYGSEFVKSSHLPLFALNLFLFVCCGMGLSFLSGMAAKNSAMINALTNILNLSLCFLGGIFVDVEIMGEGSQKAAQFLPTYWYEQIMRIGSMNETFTGVMNDTITRGLWVQVVFALACFGVGFVINKCRE